MAQNITLLGASYSDVPSVELPKTGGGTAQFDDTTDANATAADIALSKTAYVNGVKLVGTNQGGGGGGLVYETGTWTPATDSTGYFIPFANVHTSAPFYYAIVCTSAFVSSSTGGLIYTNWHQVTGEPLHTSATGLRYGNAQRIASGGSSSANSVTYPYTDQGDSTTSYSRYWAKETGIRAYQYNTGYPWRAGSTYKWIAIWAPTS